MEKKSLLKYKRPMRFSLIKNLKPTMTKIIIVQILLHNMPAQKSKLIALNQSQDKQILAILIISTDHMPVKILMIISTIILPLRRNLKNKKETTMKKIKIKMNNLRKNQQISIDNKNMLVLRLLGNNFKEESSFKRNVNFVMRRLSKERWEISLNQWEVLLPLITLCGGDIIFATITSQIIHMRSIEKNKNNSANWCQTK